MSPTWGGLDAAKPAGMAERVIDLLFQPAQVYTTLGYRVESLYS